MNPRVVILGGGFAGLRALYGLRARLGRGVDVTLVDARETSLARPALPEVRLAGKPVEQVRFPLAPILERAGAAFVR